MSVPLSKITCFSACIKLAYSFHIRIFSWCDLFVANITASIKFPPGYVTVLPKFIDTGNSVIPDCVAYTLGCSEIEMYPNFLQPSLLCMPDVFPLTYASSLLIYILSGTPSRGPTGKV